MNKKSIIRIVLAVVILALACAVPMAYRLGNTKGFIEGYVSATYETAMRIDLHQKMGIILPPQRIPSCIIQGMNLSRSLQEFKEYMGVLDSTNLGLYPGMQRPDTATTPAPAI